MPAKPHAILLAATQCICVVPGDPAERLFKDPRFAAFAQLPPRIAAHALGRCWRPYKGAQLSAEQARRWPYAYAHRFLLKYGYHGAAEDLIDWALAYDGCPPL